jgi:hypothetical protein
VVQPANPTATIPASRPFRSRTLTVLSPAMLTGTARETRMSDICLRPVGRAP